MLKYILLASAMTISVPVLAQDKPADTAGGADYASRTCDDCAGGDSGRARCCGARQAGSPVDQAMQAVTPVTDQAAPQTAQTTPAPADPAAAPAQTAQAAAAPANPAAAPAQTASAQPATSAAQIAQVVSTEFPTYDKDSNGSLNEAEFGSWMVALKTASDPTTKAESAATKTWVDQAFASADTDKNKSLSKTELTGFLTKGA